MRQAEKAARKDRGYARLRDTGFVECYPECELDGRYRGFVYVRATRDCWLK